MTDWDESSLQAALAEALEEKGLSSSIFETLKEDYVKSINVTFLEIL